MRHLKPIACLLLASAISVSLLVGGGSAAAQSQSGGIASWPERSVKVQGQPGSSVFLNLTGGGQGVQYSIVLAAADQQTCISSRHGGVVVGSERSSATGSIERGLATIPADTVTGSYHLCFRHPQGELILPKSFSTPVEFEVVGREAEDTVEIAEDPQGEVVDPVLDSVSETPQAISDEINGTDEAPSLADDIVDSANEVASQARSTAEGSEHLSTHCRVERPGAIFRGAATTKNLVSLSGFTCKGYLGRDMFVKAKMCIQSRFTVGESWDDRSCDEDDFVGPEAAGALLSESFTCPRKALRSRKHFRGWVRVTLVNLNSANPPPKTKKGPSSRWKC